MERIEARQIKKKGAKKEKRRRGGRWGASLLIAMAFSCRVPVVVGWAFPSVLTMREMAEDVFFLADQEGLAMELVFPFVCVFIILCQSL